MAFTLCPGCGSLTQVSAEASAAPVARCAGCRREFVPGEAPGGASGRYATVGGPPAPALLAPPHARHPRRGLVAPVALLGAFVVLATAGVMARPRAAPARLWVARVAASPGLVDVELGLSGGNRGCAPRAPCVRLIDEEGRARPASAARGAAPAALRFVGALQPGRYRVRMECGRCRAEAPLDLRAALPNP